MDDLVVYGSSGNARQVKPIEKSKGVKEIM